ncbi:formate dehydrogenase accessory sulfurtransferase FdhD [Pseudomonas luteola]|uniref:formate dehydrogenase accessory sulfurtransferase FdhD n=1 Tax=Pseudomonas luteola TaxID=47886 RepID=UPI001239DB7B|nr:MULTISPECIES: formate dehydrogenase accessory sulfurtransferase FdhD [Pseudomonas]MBA1250882.1 formate dehydrogenase accessory sulfurtransferase FdhD [Pseudomonas zeshuii]QEU30978.1 formate dehydrogenase accessory sulfurtransferase FdhD [Pseudomonas luteola]
MSRSNPHADTPSEQPASQALHGYSYAELKNPEVTGQTPLAEECAVAISYNGISHTVMMATPADIEDFVAGLSLSAGIIHSIDDIYGMQVRRVGEALNVEVEISSRTFWALKSQRRQMAGTSGCGLCGVEALEQALPQLDRLRKVQLPPAEHLANLRQRINEAQQLGQRSGAVHAALFANAEGELGLCREDIGRHNALDKLIGALMRQKINTRAGFVVVTSRCSLELIHKAVRANLATLVTLSAPTGLAVEWARRHRLNLIHLPHQSPPRVYSPAPLIPEHRE